MKKFIKRMTLIISVLILSVSALSGCVGNDIPEFSKQTMFTLRVYEPWIYESLHYTLLNDGTLIVLYYNTELGREQLSDERMAAIRKIFSQEKVYKMNVGKEDERTDGTSRYIVLYDSGENEIRIGGYELTGRKFQNLFAKLYALCEDDYTRQFSDLLDECNRDGTTYQDRYMKNNTDLPEAEE